MDALTWALNAQKQILSYEAAWAGALVSTALWATTAYGLVVVTAYLFKAATAYEQGVPQNFGGLVTIGLKFGLVIFVVSNWAQPAPGLGVPLGTWLPNIGLKLAGVIGLSGADAVQSTLKAWNGIESIGSFGVGMLSYIFCQIFLFFANILLAIIIVGPTLITSILIFVGPVFIVGWCVPELSGWARGYVRSLATYSLVPVLAAASLQLISAVILSKGVSAGSMAIEMTMPAVSSLAVALGAAGYAMLSCVRLANQVMSGSAASGLGWYHNVASVQRIFR